MHFTYSTSKILLAVLASFALFSSLVHLACPPVSSNATDFFQDLTTGQYHVFVLFRSPNCGFCQEPTKELPLLQCLLDSKNESQNYRVYQFTADVAAHKDAFTRLNVTAYPTIYFITKQFIEQHISSVMKDNKANASVIPLPNEYAGARNSQAMYQFIQSELANGPQSKK